MPTELKRAFIKEYGKKNGTRIFYAWENKHKYKVMKGLITKRDLKKK